MEVIVPINQTQGDGETNSEKRPPQIVVDSALPADQASVVEEGKDAWLRVVSGFTVCLVAWGPYLGFGVFQSFYQSELLSTYSPSQISWIGSLPVSLIMISGIFSGPAYDKGYLRHLMVVGCTLVVLGFMLLSVCTEYYQVILCQSVLAGLGSGMIYVPAVAAVSTSFNRQRPLAMGITNAGTSVGGVIFPILFAKLQPRIGFPWTIRVIASIQLVGALVALLILLREENQPKTARKLFQLDALKETPFVTFCFAVMLQLAAYNIGVAYIPTYGSNKLGLSPATSFYCLAAVNAASAFSRIIPLFLAQKIGIMPVLFSATIACVALLFGWIGVRTVPEFWAFSIFWGFFSGVFVAADPVVVATKPISSSSADVGTRLGMMFLFAAMGILGAPPAAGALIDLQTRSFVKAQVFSGVVLALSLCLLVRPWLAIRSAEKATNHDEVESKDRGITSKMVLPRHLSFLRLRTSNSSQPERN